MFVIVKNELIQVLHGESLRMYLSLRLCRVLIIFNGFDLYIIRSLMGNLKSRNGL